jgi:hypothetical protein
LDCFLATSGNSKTKKELSLNSPIDCGAQILFDSQGYYLKKSLVITIRKPPSKMYGRAFQAIWLKGYIQTGFTLFSKLTNPLNVWLKLVRKPKIC